MDVATEVSRAEALEVLLKHICQHLTPERRDSQMAAQGGFANMEVMYVYNHGGRRGVMVDMVGRQDCCHRFDWEELLDACGGAPRQAGLL